MRKPRTIVATAPDKSQVLVWISDETVQVATRTATDDIWSPPYDITYDETDLPSAIAQLLAQHGWEEP